MRAFVTGATGFLGGALVRKLRERGDEVVALVRDPARAAGLDAQHTRGRVVDETYERPERDYVSAYDETKHLAHLAAKERVARGVPIVIVQPGAVYGPGDHSELGAQLRQARDGKLLAKALAGVGVNAVHV